MIIEYEGQVKKFNNIWFIGCTHFGHEKIISLCNRPFQSIDDMDKTIIDNINKVVHRDDLLILLGDFCKWWDKPTTHFYHYFNRLDVLNVMFLFGNHDKKIKNAVKTHKDIIWSGDILDAVIDDVPLVGCHFPLSSWNKSFHGSKHVFAHVHNETSHTKKNSICVCVEQTDYKPLSFKDVQERISVKNEIKA